MTIHPQGPTALYRLYDVDGHLLYVGISNDPEARWRSHLYGIAQWPARAVRRTDEWFASRAEAEAAEYAAIKIEEPIFNGTHNFVEVDFSPEVWQSPITGRDRRAAIASRIQQELTCGAWGPGMRIPSAGRMAEVSGVSRSTATKALGQFIKAGLLAMHGGRGVFVNPYEPNR